MPDVTQQDRSKAGLGSQTSGVSGPSFSFQGTPRGTQGSRNPRLGQSRPGVSRGPGMLINPLALECDVFLRGAISASGDSRAPGTGTPREPGAAECRLCPASLQKNSLSWQAHGDAFSAVWQGRAEFPGSPGSPWGGWRGPRTLCQQARAPVGPIAATGERSSFQPSTSCSEDTYSNTSSTLTLSMLYALNSGLRHNSRISQNPSLCAGISSRAVWGKGLSMCEPRFLRPGNGYGDTPTRMVKRKGTDSIKC